MSVALRLVVKASHADTDGLYALVYAEGQPHRHAHRLALKSGAPFEVKLPVAKRVYVDLYQQQVVRRSPVKRVGLVRLGVCVVSVAQLRRHEQNRAQFEVAHNNYGCVRDFCVRAELVNPTHVPLLDQDNMLDEAQAVLASYSRKQSEKLAAAGRWDCSAESVGAHHEVPIDLYARYAWRSDGGSRAETRALAWMARLAVVHVGVSHPNVTGADPSKWTDIERAEVLASVCLFWIRMHPYKLDDFRNSGAEQWAQPLSCPEPDDVAYDCEDGALVALRVMGALDALSLEARRENPVLAELHDMVHHRYYALLCTGTIKPPGASESWHEYVLLVDRRLMDRLGSSLPGQHASLEEALAREPSVLPTVRLEATAMTAATSSDAGDVGGHLDWQGRVGNEGGLALHRFSDGTLRHMHEYRDTAMCAPANWPGRGTFFWRDPHGHMGVSTYTLLDLPREGAGDYYIEWAAGEAGGVIPEHVVEAGDLVLDTLPPVPPLPVPPQDEARRATPHASAASPGCTRFYVRADEWKTNRAQLAREAQQMHARIDHFWLTNLMQVVAVTVPRHPGHRLTTGAAAGVPVLKMPDLIDAPRVQFASLAVLAFTLGDQPPTPARIHQAASVHCKALTDVTAEEQRVLVRGAAAMWAMCSVVRKERVQQRRAWTGYATATPGPYRARVLEGRPGVGDRRLSADNRNSAYFFANLYDKVRRAKASRFGVALVTPQRRVRLNLSNQEETFPVSLEYVAHLKPRSGPDVPTKNGAVIVRHYLATDGAFRAAYMHMTIDQDRTVGAQMLVTPLLDAWVSDRDSDGPSFGKLSMVLLPVGTRLDEWLLHRLRLVERFASDRPEADRCRLLRTYVDCRFRADLERELWPHLEGLCRALNLRGLYSVDFHLACLRVQHDDDGGDVLPLPNVRHVALNSCRFVLEQPPDSDGVAWLRAMFQVARAELDNFIRLQLVRYGAPLRDGEVLPTY